MERIASQWSSHAGDVGIRLSRSDNERTTREVSRSLRWLAMDKVIAGRTEESGVVLRSCESRYEMVAKNSLGDWLRARSSMMGEPAVLEELAHLELR